MDDQHVLITGGAGFIGSNLANYLSKHNVVTVIDDESLGDADNLDPSVRYCRRSVLEDDLPTGVDVVVHLAALSSYQMHEDDQCHGARVNIEGFVNTVTQAIQDGCERIVYASTSSVYGTHTEPMSPDEPVSVNTAYEASKLGRERYAEYFANHHGIETVGLRLYSVYEGFGGNEGHKGSYANVISQFADAIHSGESPMVYGDGTQTRDFTHVDDVVKAIELAAELAPTGVYNVGTGTARSFNEVIALLNHSFGTNVQPEYVDNPIPEKVYVHDTCADPSRFMEFTGWSPTIDLEAGISQLCNQYHKPRI